VQDLLGMMLPVLRARSVMPRLVNTAFGDQPAEQHDSVRVPVPPTIAIDDVTPAATPPTTPDQTFESVTVPLTTWKKAAFHMSDKDKVEVAQGVIPGSAQAALAAIVNHIDTAILTAGGVFASRAVGTAATVPFASLALAIQPMTNLSINLVPPDMRHVVCDPLASAALFALPAFSESTFVGDVTAMVDGAFQGNRRIGAQWWEDQNVPLHTAGTGTSYLTNVGAGLAVGATAIAIDTGSGTILPGDVVVFEDDTNKYVVTAGVAAPGTITIGKPGLRQALADGKTVTVTAAHRANLAFHKSAIAFATRPMKPSDAAVAMQSISDPVSGLTIRMEVSRQYKRDNWELDVLYGAKGVRSEGIIKILG
jgi:hypothetical protein